jgi:hypothetical protein
MCEGEKKKKKIGGTSTYEREEWPISFQFVIPPWILVPETWGLVFMIPP